MSQYESVKDLPHAKFKLNLAASKILKISAYYTWEFFLEFLSPFLVDLFISDFLL